MALQMKAPGLSCGCGLYILTCASVSRTKQHKIDSEVVSIQISVIAELDTVGSTLDLS